MKKALLIFFVLFCITSSQSQVLISLIFGDKLNSPFLEFGLEGGANFSSISNLETSKTKIDFNLGFYFDFKSKKNPSWMLNTGVIVKSPMGAKNVSLYSLNNADLDNTFKGGNVDREIRYFNIPILIKYKFKNNIYIKSGPQLGLLAKAFDKFSKEINGEDIAYKNNVRDKIHVIDAGIVIGAGYHINSGKGLNITLQYYYGLVPLMKGDLSPNQYNRSLYLTAGIPIGKGKADKKRAEKETFENGVILPEEEE
ncbi:porin family protein [Flavobacterium sp. W22_SRS_FK3]|uniref:porin family protein n=1 Tax=Flavobacterium sp. W22_SRS_FK3 TaxID=3240275 RepID=UPI003F9233F4